MADPRIYKLAKVLVHYSLELKSGQKFMLETAPLARELALAVYEEAVKAGAHVFVLPELPGSQELFYKHASDEQLDFISPIDQLVNETFDATLFLSAAENRRALASVDPTRIARAQKAHAGLMQTFMDRSAKKELRWCTTIFPNNANAQDADMSLRDYEEFVYAAGMLNEDNPVAFWKAEGARQQKLIRWLSGHDQVVIKGADVELTLSIKGRTFEEADGKYNFPDGEIFTGPVEDSVNGWIRYKYPAIYSGKEVSNIELRFENGRVAKEKADKNQELLTALLDTDAGSRYLGEWGIGTNYGIQRFTKSMLFDEKIGGTIHLAVGASYPETGGKNESGLHWDMLCDMADSEITIDGELFYKNGKPVVE